ncbi:hypothetical protein [Pedobacter sp.]|uniref:hypothetical protein n=1 Tax=Pedobacter sp. TaxID=1411316 RepID=UPI003BAC9531
MNKKNFHLPKSRRILFQVLLVTASFAFACRQENKKNPKNETDSIPVTSPHSIDKTYVYRGVLPTKYHLPAIGSMVLTMAEGKNEGTFVYKLDYGEVVNDSGSVVLPYTDHGTFKSENSDDWGTIYVMKGQRPLQFYYRPTDNKLAELDSDKKQMTGHVLTGINPADSAETREDVLGRYTENMTLGNGLLWSAMNKEIIDLEQADVKLEPLAEKTAKKPAYILFNDDQSLAELFLPDSKKGSILKRKGNEGGYIWSDGRYELFSWKGYVLRYKDGKNIFAGD